MTCKLILASLVCCFCGFADEVVWSWATPNFTPCPGIGINGSYRVTARGNIVTDASGARTMNQVTVYATSPVFSPDKASITAELDVTSVPAPAQSIVLAPAPPGSVAATPGPNDTPSLFLPDGTTVPINANTQFRFIISAVVQDETGASCAVGSTTKDIDPNQPANSARNKARATLLNARPAAAAKIPGPFQRQLTLHLAPGTQRRVSFTLSLSSIFNVEVHGTLTVASGATTLFTSSVLMHIPAGSPAILHIPDVSIPDGISDVTISIAGSSLPAVPTGAVKLGVGASSL